MTQSPGQPGDSARAEDAAPGPEQAQVPHPPVPFPDDGGGGGGFFTPRTPIPQLWSMLLAIGFVLMFVGVWWFLTSGPSAEERIISPVILPSPMEIAQSFPSLWTRRELPKNTAVSVWRVVRGFVVAVVIVLPLGLAMGSFPGVRAFFEPLNVVAGYLPLITIVPLTFAWFLPLGQELATWLSSGSAEVSPGGPPWITYIIPVGDEFQKVMFLALACFFFMLPLVVKAVTEVDDVYVNTGYTLGARTPAIVGRVLFPIALPEIYYAMRMAFGVAWTWIIVAEMMLADSGLGYIFNQAYRYEKPHMYWVALIILAIGFAADRILDRLGRWLFPYRG